MNFATVLHRRFEADGVGYVYATPSASILRLDAVSDEILAAFSAPGGADPGAFLAERSGRADVAEFKVTLEEMVSIGLVRPVGEAAPPAPKLPPMPFPLATLVLNVTNKCNLSCTYCYEYGEDRLTEGSGSKGAGKPLMADDTARERHQVGRHTLRATASREIEELADDTRQPGIEIGSCCDMSS